MGSDGEGIRTLVLVSGCPLRCKYCINPYTWDGSQNTKMMTAHNIYDRICIDRPYILSTNGGITFGGGEPLLYPGLISEIRGICEPEMTIYVETALNVPWENIEKTVAVVKRYYVDIKTLDNKKYLEYTGCNLEVARGNLAKLIKAKGADSVIVRIPEIPGLTNHDEQQSYKKELLSVGAKRFNLFRYSEV